MNEQSLTVVNQRQLAQYGSRDDVKELGERIKRFIPGGGKMNESEALSFAQFSIAQGLDPFAREIWYIPGVGVVTGIEGYRKMARRQSTFVAQHRIMTGEEREMHGLKNLADVGAICEVFRHDVLRQAVEINKMAGDVVIPVKPIVGIGVWRAGDNVCKGRTPLWTAQKRAEADGLRKAFDLHASYADELGGKPTLTANGMDVIEAEVEPFPDVEAEPERQIAEKPVQEPEYANGKLVRPLEPALLKAALLGKVANDAGEPATGKQIGFLARKLQECFSDEPDPAQCYHSALQDLWNVDSGKKLTKAQAGATLDWLLSKDGTDDTGDTPLHEHAPEEARRVLKQALIDAGQQEMELE